MASAIQLAQDHRSDFHQTTPGDPILDARTSDADNGLSVEERNQQFFGEFFNENSVTYLAKSAGSRWFRFLLLEILKAIEPGEIETVADVGCGIGHKTAVLQEYFNQAKVSGFDFSTSAIEVATKAYGPRGIQFSCTDITKTAHETPYDLITAFDVLEHLDQWQTLVEDLIRVNKRYILLSFPVGRMRPYEVNIGHYRNFKKYEMEEFMATKGYMHLKSFYAGFPFFSPITRDLTQMFFKNYSETTTAPMTRKAKVMHDIWYLLYRYGSMRSRGDVFIGLFQKRPRHG